LNLRIIFSLGCQSQLLRAVAVWVINFCNHVSNPINFNLFVEQRGVGARAVGTSLSLVAPAEDKAHRMIADAVQAKFANVVMDGRLLTAAQTRTNLASKIVAAEELEHRTQSSNKWFQEKAEEVGLEIDDDLVEDESNRAPREQAQLQEAKKAKGQLARLLREPMKAQRFGKFLSSVMPSNYASVTPHLKKKP
jgi:hypothetical protein